eukprot:385066_1
MSDIEEFDKWLDENKLKAYREKFIEEAGELTALSSENLETDQAIKDFIADDIGEKKKLKAKKIFNAIKKLQETLAKDASAKDKLRQENDMKLDTIKYEYDYNEIVSVKDETQIYKIVAKNQKLIKNKQNEFYGSIDVNDAMNKLATCGVLIQLAYACSHGFKCQVGVITLLNEYHTLVKDSYVASAEFVSSSINALEYHELALQVFREDTKTSIEFLIKCSTLAELMANLADELIAKSKSLAKIAKKTLQQAVDDNVMTQKQKKELEARMAKAKADQEYLETFTKELHDDLEQCKIEQVKAVKEAETERGRKFALDLINGLAGPITETIGSVTKIGLAGKAIDGITGNKSDSKDKDNKDNNKNNNNDDDGKDDDNKDEEKSDKNQKKV